MNDLIEWLRYYSTKSGASAEKKLNEAADALEQRSYSQLAKDNKWAGEQLMKKDKLITELTDLYNVALADVKRLQDALETAWDSKS